VVGFKANNNQVQILREFSISNRFGGIVVLGAHNLIDYLAIFDPALCARYS
jgi:hypothetical protein